jgi:hypothetical protein
MPMHIKASSSSEEHPSRLPEICTISMLSFRPRPLQYGILTKDSHGGRTEKEVTSTRNG